MSEEEKASARRKRSTFGVVFLTIFMDMVGFSVIFPLFPAMLDHYLQAQEAAGGGVLTAFVDSVEGTSREMGEYDNKSFRIETVIFGGILGSLYAILQFFFAPVWGRLSDKFGRKPILFLTLGGTCLGYLFWIFAGSFWILVLSRVLGGVFSGNLSVATASIADITSRESRSKEWLSSVWLWIGLYFGPRLG